MSLVNNRLGHEEIQLAFYEAIQAGINDALDVAETNGIDYDARLAAASGVDFQAVSLERFEAPNIHYGHRPSMILAPIDQYPSMSINVFLGTPSPENSGADYGYSSAVRCAIEAIVKSDLFAPDPQYQDHSYEGQSVVGRRLKRTVEAIHATVSSDSSLGGYLLPPTTDPTVTYGDIFERDDEQARQRCYWQGVRIEYTNLKQTISY